MTVVDLKLELPEDLARAAEAEGLLSSRAVVDLVRAEVRRAAAKRMLDGAARASAAGSEPMSMAEIQREVRAVRRARASAERSTG